VCVLPTSQVKKCALGLLALNSQFGTFHPAFVAAAFGGGRFDNGGMTVSWRLANDPAPLGCEPPPGFAPVDHDQRKTLNLGFNANLPWQSFPSMNMYYGSGFANGSQQSHLQRLSLQRSTRNLRRIPLSFS
jgi:hypothetical protein